MELDVQVADARHEEAIRQQRGEAGWKDTPFAGEVWVGLREGGVVGSLQLVDCGEGAVLLDAVVVGESRRGQGTGAAMIRAVLAGRQADWWLECRAERMPFYARLGFEEVERSGLPPGVRTYVEEPGVVPEDRPQHFMHLT